MSSREIAWLFFQQRAVRMPRENFLLSFLQIDRTAFYGERSLMLDADYIRLTSEKKAAAAKHDAGKRIVRERMADAIVNAPTFAIEFADGVLKNRTGSWQQWSRTAWEEILRTKTPAEIADMLVDPVGGQQEALADSHPFAGLAAAVR